MAHLKALAGYRLATLFASFGIPLLLLTSSAGASPTSVIISGHFPGYVISGVSKPAVCAKFTQFHPASLKLANGSGGFAFTSYSGNCSSTRMTSLITSAGESFDYRYPVNLTTAAATGFVVTENWSIL